MKKKALFALSVENCRASHAERRSQRGVRRLHAALTF
jgi:hypothetical protein